MKKNSFGFEGSYLILWSRKVSIFWIFFALLVIHFLYVSIGKTIDNSELQKKGIVTNATITDVRKVGSKGIIRCSYTFEVNSFVYSGSVDDDYKLGDTIQVLYLMENPAINRDRNFLKKIHKQ